MTNDVIPPQPDVGPPETVLRPPAAPEWVTAELITDTIVAWQPYYADELTPADALEILLTVGRLFESLGDVADEREEVSGAGPRQQP